MDGNTHYEDYQLDLDNATDYDAAMMQLQATLALAYEQRTANLIAVGQLIVAIDGPTVNMKGALDLIESRLGLEA